MQRKNRTFDHSEKIYHLFLLTVSFFVPLRYAKRKQTIIEKFVPAICKQIHFRGAAICYLDRSVRYIQFYRSVTVAFKNPPIGERTKVLPGEDRRGQT